MQPKLETRFSGGGFWGSGIPMWKIEGRDPCLYPGWHFGFPSSNRHHHCESLIYCWSPPYFSSPTHGGGARSITIPAEIWGQPSSGMCSFHSDVKQIPTGAVRLRPALKNSKESTVLDISHGHFLVLFCFLRTRKESRRETYLLIISFCVPFL